jgi:hypothetical protein
MYDSNLTVGIEIEFPQTERDAVPMIHGGQKSEELYELIGHAAPWKGRHTYDGTVGLETVSNQLPISEGADWYRETIREIESSGGVRFNPTSLLRWRDNGETCHGTAGLHIHMSSMSEEEARDLYDLSLHPDVQLMACSAVIQDQAPDYNVFRDSWCRMQYNAGRDSVVNSRHGGHYEWRLPEPQTVNHFENLMQFLDTLKSEGKQSALDFAKSVVTDGETTAIERAKRIGTDVEVEEPKADWNASRSGRPATSYFYDNARRSSSAPYIYKVSADDREGAPGCGEYYGFYTNNGASDRVMSDDGAIEVDGDTCLYADTLAPVPSGTVKEKVDEAIEEYRMENDSKTKKRLSEVL